MILFVAFLKSSHVTLEPTQLESEEDECRIT
jgi:hypothetical protein